jgi:hypothetical protein
MLTQGISDADWSRLAQLAKTTPQQIRTQYEARLAEQTKGLREIEVNRGTPVQSGSCVKRDFDIGLSSMIGLSGYVEFCANSSSDWTAAFHVCLNVAGSSVWCTDETLTPTNAQLCYHPTLVVAKADLCLAIQGSNHCFNISGDACYWALGTWSCVDFNETLFCFG